MKRATMRALVSAAALPFMLIWGCSAVDDERQDEPVFQPDMGSGDKTPVQHFDTGETCFYAGGYPDDLAEMNEPQRFEENSTLAVTVATTECLSMTCDVDRHASCTVDRDTNIITVTSLLAYNEVDTPMCTLDCGQLVARCQSEPLPAGDYTIVHGDARAELKVPSVVAPCDEAPMRPGPAQ